MPPHCDSLDGPVVKAAKQALAAGNVDLVLPYVPAEGEAEVIAAFKKVLPLRSNGAAMREVAELYFFETVVRVHRAGEGEPFTGLKPAGLDVGPIIPVAEKAIETESPDELARVLEAAIHTEVNSRFAHMLHLKERAGHSVADAREYTEAMLTLQVWSHKVYMTAKSAAHGEPHEH